MAGGRFRELLKKYGKVAVGVHCSVSAASITGLYVAIKNNVDVESILHKLHLPSPSHGDQDTASQEQQQQQQGSEGNAKKNSNLAASAGGALALAILCNKALFPIRVPITIALTPPVSRFLARRRLIKNGV